MNDVFTKVSCLFFSKGISYRELGCQIDDFWESLCFLLRGSYAIIIGRIESSIHGQSVVSWTFENFKKRNLKYFKKNLDVVEDVSYKCIKYKYKIPCTLHYINMTKVWILA
jgi:hypothetical protein